MITITITITITISIRLYSNPNPNGAIISINLVISNIIIRIDISFLLLLQYRPLEDKKQNYLENTTLSSATGILLIFIKQTLNRSNCILCYSYRNLF